MIRFRCTQCSYSETLSYHQAQEKNLHGRMPMCPRCGSRIGFLRPSEELKALLTILVLIVILAISLYQGPPADSFSRALRIGMVILTVFPGGWWLFLYVAFWMKCKGADAHMASVFAVLCVAFGVQILLAYLWLGRWVNSAG